MEENQERPSEEKVPDRVFEGDGYPGAPVSLTVTIHPGTRLEVQTISRTASDYIWIYGRDEFDLCGSMKFGGTPDQQLLAIERLIAAAEEVRSRVLARLAAAPR